MPQPAIDDLVAKTAAVVLPSLEEGLGLPAWEAGRLGIPLVASDIPAIGETLGDVPIYCDPRSEPSIAEAIDRVPSTRREPLKDAATEEEFAQAILNLLAVSSRSSNA